jgi:exoribonuclease R
VVELAEAVLLSGQEGKTFDAVVTDVDERGAKVQLRDLPVVARVSAREVAPGEPIIVRLIAVDQVRRMITFELAQQGASSA